MNDKYIPKALQHAEWLELSLAIGAQDAADELRRLHEVEVAYGVMMAQAESRIAEQEPVALESVYETIIQWDENDGKRSRRELARRIVALYANTGDKP